MPLVVVPKATRARHARALWRTGNTAMHKKIRGAMFYYAIAFFSIAIAAALYGVSGVTEGTALIGGFLATVFLIIALICVLLTQK
jgi:uncharacterized membrane protein YtjA (UPF0391 family)